MTGFKPKEQVECIRLSEIKLRAAVHVNTHWYNCRWHMIETPACTLGCSSTAPQLHHHRLWESASAQTDQTPHGGGFFFKKHDFFGTTKQSSFTSPVIQTPAEVKIVSYGAINSTLVSNRILLHCLPHLRQHTSSPPVSVMITLHQVASGVSLWWRNVLQP